MDTAFFYPPTCLALSSEVIGDVKQHDRLRYGMVTPRTVSSRELSDRNLKKTSQRATSHLGKRVRAAQIFSTETTVNMLTELEKKDRRREQCRVNQAQYRKRRRRVVTSLQLNNQLLQKEIQDLDLQYRSYCLGIPAKQTPWTFATRYFALFRESVSRSQNFSALALRSLRVSTTSDVTDGFKVGPEAILENMLLFSYYFRNFHVVLEELKKGPTADSIVAITTTSVTISENTLRLVFPHLAEDWVESQHSLGSKLLNQQLVMRGLVRFDWDNITNRVVGIYSQSDLLTPMLRTLGSLQDVSRAFNGALVTPVGRLISNRKRD